MTDRPEPRPPSAPDAVPDLSAEHLPCGRRTEDLLDLVLDGRARGPHDGRDDHQRTCVHCRALAAGAARLWEPLRASARTLETPPPDLLESVTTSVRALGRDPVHLVVPGTRGATRVAADVVRQIAERTAAAVPGVAVALARHASAPPAGGVGLAGQQVVVDLAVVVAYGASIPAVAARVRADVRADVAAQTPATDVHVDIYVDDVTG